MSDALIWFVGGVCFLVGFTAGALMGIIGMMLYAAKKMLGMANE